MSRLWWPTTSPAIFHDSARTIRYGGAENLYGLSDTVIGTCGRDFAVASTPVSPPSMAGKIGRQMQTWVRFAEGWRVVHVSVIEAP